MNASNHAEQEQTGSLSSDTLDIELPKEIADLMIYPELQSMEPLFHSHNPTQDQFHSQTIPSPHSIPTLDSSYRESDSLLENSGVHFSIAPLDSPTLATTSPREPERRRRTTRGQALVASINQYPTRTAIQTYACGMHPQALVSSPF